MNIYTPVSEIMSKDLITLTPRDKLTRVKEVFDNHRIHHIPVVEYKKIVGIVSKTDLCTFLKGVTKFSNLDPNTDDMRLRNYLVEDIMTEGLAKVEPTTRISVVLEVFKENLFHAIPVVNELEELVGIVTTYDIIDWLSEVAINPAVYAEK